MLKCMSLFLIQTTIYPESLVPLYQWAYLAGKDYWLVPFLSQQLACSTVKIDHQKGGFQFDTSLLSSSPVNQVCSIFSISILSPSSGGQPSTMAIVLLFWWEPLRLPWPTTLREVGIPHLRLCFLYSSHGFPKEHYLIMLIKLFFSIYIFLNSFSLIQCHPWKWGMFIVDKKMDLIS